MRTAATTTLEDYSRSSWRRGLDLYLEHPFIHAGRWFRYMSRRAWPGRAMYFTDGDGNRYVSPKNYFTSLAVAVLGQRDPNVMLFLRQWIRPGFVVCDVGANIFLSDAGLVFRDARSLPLPTICQLTTTMSVGTPPRLRPAFLQRK